MADSDVDAIVSRVLQRLEQEGPGAAPAASAAPARPSPSGGVPPQGWFVTSPGGGGPATSRSALTSGPVASRPAPGADALLSQADAGIREGVFDTMDDAVQAANEAYRAYAAVGLEARRGILASMRRRFQEQVPFLAELAVAETGLGRVKDKVAKNHLACEKTPGVEDVQPEAFTGDHGLTVVERAPLGVIGSVTPSTNPSETVVNNSICFLAGGNAAVFNPHPSARRVSLFALSLLNRAAVEAGGPPNLLTAVREPSIETSGQLMSHPGVRTLLVTGGGAVVKAAMQSGKRAICAGPGNPPVVVDATADLRAAARHTIVGHSTDNNIVCIAEKEVFAVDAIADAFMDELENAGAYRLPANRVRDLVDLVLPGGKVERRFVGKNPSVILREIGIEVSDEVRTVFLEVDKDHPLVHTEQLMPVLPVARVPDVDTGIAMAVKAEKGFNHTAMMHSRDLEALDRMARALQVSIFVKNGPCLAGLGYGGEGFTAWSIAGRTGEGLTRARTFTRERRCVLKGYFRIVLASDHGGFEMKQALVAHVRELGHAPRDLGPSSKESCDYPDLALLVARAVAEGSADVGIMVDGAGIGSAMVCNKVPGVLAANCYDLYSAVNSREHNGANVLTLGGQTLGLGHARKIVTTWLETPFGGDRHLRRVRKILDLDRRFARSFP